MSTRIKIELSEKSINDAIKKLENYKKSLSKKNDEFVEKLAEEGIVMIRASLTGIDLNGDGWSYNADKESISSGSVSSMRINLSGERILFIEFGAGVTYSQPQHPKAGEFGYGPGTYPGFGRGLDPNGWTYTADDGTRKHTYGNQAYAPAWNASVQMRNKIVSIAKDVFGK